MATPDGNVQDMAVADKEHPSLAATEEAQDVASLNRIVVGMPAYTDPHNPMTLSGSVNLSVDQHPIGHSDDYGVDVAPGGHVFETTHSPLAAPLTEDDKAPPEDRDDWKKADWQALAKNYDLPSSGNIETIRQRVEEYEDDEEAVEARRVELDGLSQAELNDLASEYDLDPAKFDNKEDLADAILSAEREQD